MTQHYLDGKIIDTPENFIALTEKEIEAEDLKDRTLMVRNNRNALLAETDWMANSDVTMSDSWKTYRQALRDLPATDGFPDVDFPTKPS